MLNKQRSCMNAVEDDTLELVEGLDANKVFIKTMPDETQRQIVDQYRRSKECIRAHGSEHKITLDQLRSLAEDLISVRHFASAATVLDRACLGCKRCYGTEHVNVALVLSRQGFAQSSDRKFEAAYTCYEKSLLLLEQLFCFRVYYNSTRRKEEATSTDIVIVPTIAVPVVDGLGYTLGMLQRHRESEFCYRTLLEYYIGEGVDRTQEPYLPCDPSVPVGKQHPEALKAVNKLAQALQAQGKFSEAERLCSDSLDDSVQALGANHPTTQTCVVTMAQLKHSQGKIQEAEVMYRRSLACNEEVLGLMHIETLANVMHLAGLRAEQKDFHGAETLYTRALSGYEATVGPHNSLTIEAVHCVGAMFLKQQRPTQALPYLDRALEERKGYYGDAHPATLATLFCVGECICVSP
jgi:tetratricopeptide (TPR) repeat protein